MRVAIITARGGSKRIPGKNIRDFLGKPIISYSISEAIKCKLFDEVMVSTDSEEIAEIAKKYGASIPFLRSKENANDIANTSDVVLEVLENYRNIGKEYDEFCCIYPTAPFITVQKLIDSYKLLLKSGVSSVIPVVPFSFPPQRGVSIKDGFLCPVDIKAMNMRSQDLEILYHDCGQFYWCKTKDFLRNKAIFSDHSVPFILSEMEAQDIDNEIDWRLAELKYRMFIMKDGV